MFKNMGYNKFKIRVLYKSGNSHTFWTYVFSYHQGSYKWEAVNPTNRPIIIGADEIEAVYVIGIKKGFRGDKE